MKNEKMNKLGKEFIFVNNLICFFLKLFSHFSRHSRKVNFFHILYPYPSSNI